MNSEILLVLTRVIQTLSVVKPACLRTILRNISFAKSKIGPDVLVRRAAPIRSLFIIGDYWSGDIHGFAASAVCFVDVLARCLAALLRSE